MSLLDKMALLVDDGICQTSCPQAPCSRVGYYRPIVIGACGPPCGLGICPPEAPDGCIAPCAAAPGIQ